MKASYVSDRWRSWQLCLYNNSTIPVRLPLILLTWLGLIFLSTQHLLRAQQLGFIRDDRVSSTGTVLDDDGSMPQIVWLMSFPNSGTTYTLTNTEQLTGRTTATNYALQESHDSPPVSVRPDDTSFGPAWHSAALPHPHRALTKTHCKTTLSNYTEFEHGCRTAKWNNISGRLDEHIYDRRLVSAAVHLIRHPLDNLVSRKRYMLRHEVKNGKLTAEQLQFFTDTPTGFSAWCDYKLKTSTLWRQNAPYVVQQYKPLEEIPCYVDLLYYIRWHNFAAKLLNNEYDIPYYVLYYEDYAQDYMTTIQDLYTFVFQDDTTVLIRDWTAGAPFNSTNKHYHDVYFTPEQQLAVERVVRNLTTPESWKLLRRYYE